MQADMHGKVCIVTGANSGIGRVAAIDLAGRGATVVLICRNHASGSAVVEEIARRGGDAALLIADLASQRQVREVAAAFLKRFDRLDVLINNAGVAGWGTRFETEDGLETTFAVNHLAPFLLTNLLLDTLKASAPSRVVTVSSAAHRNVTLNMDDLQGERRYSGFGAYSRSKLANILFTHELSRRLEGTGVTANCLHPGVVATGIFRNIPRWMRFILTSPLVLSPERGAETMIYLATASELAEVSGLYFVRRKPVRSSRASRDAETARRLWWASEVLTAASDT
ncbi:MAG: SDR family oxidoreductase [Rhodospirillales bacterium]|nr:SDR family oxidoreductase [Rhodospirillales bacterium]